MSAGMPELGSKISLISKADIRYEGRLFTVDPQECTIALANVKSFGTEDRETQFPVAPQNQVYEYILFRGSDIKDIRVVNSVSSLPNDPAIVQMTVQPMGQQSYQPQPGFGHPMMGQMGGMGGQFGAPYGMGGMGAMGPMMGMGAAPNRPAMSKQPSELGGLGPIEPSAAAAISNSQSAANVEPKDQSLEDGVLDMISGGSRSTTPTSLLTRKSPTMDQGVQVNQQSNNVGKIGDKQMRNTQGPHRGDREGGRASGMSQYSEGKQQHHQQQRDGQMHGGQNMRNRGPGGGGGGGGGGGWMNNQRGPPNQMVRLPQRGPPGGPRGGRGGNFRQNQQPGGAGNKAKNTLKFDNDYDFEQANTEFEELRSKLAKTKIEGAPAGPESEKKDDSGNETGAGDNEPEEEQSEIVHYDKAKSFFDNISCEAVERSKGRSQRTDWRTERKLNSETFGVASMRRGNFRGRGYYNNRGGNMGGGNMMYHRNNQPGGNQNYNRGGYRGPRGGGGGGGQRRPNNQPQQQQNSQTGSTGGPSNQSNRTASTSSEQQPSNSTASTNANASNANAATPSSSSTSTNQSATRLVTGTA